MRARALGSACDALFEVVALMWREVIRTHPWLWTTVWWFSSECMSYDAIVLQACCFSDDFFCVWCFCLEIVTMCDTACNCSIGMSPLGLAGVSGFSATDDQVIANCTGSAATTFSPLSLSVLLRYVCFETRDWLEINVFKRFSGPYIIVTHYDFSFKGSQIYLFVHFCLHVPIALHSTFQIKQDEKIISRTTEIRTGDLRCAKWSTRG